MRKVKVQLDELVYTLGCPEHPKYEFELPPGTSCRACKLLWDVIESALRAKTGGAN